MVPKFRAWDVHEKRMLKVYRLSFDGPIEGVQVHCYLDDRDAEGSTEYSYDSDGLILEQSTGLKDANGKEIYEGDIVRMQRPGFHERACYEVKCFVQDVCIFQIVKVTDGSTLFESPSNGRDVEIVGNVHEGPELLEAQHDTRTD